MKRRVTNWPQLVRDGGWRTVKGSPGFHSYFRIQRGVRYVVVKPVRCLGWILQINGVPVTRPIDLEDALVRADALSSGVAT